MNSKKWQSLWPPLLVILWTGCSLPCREELMTNPDLSPPQLVELISGEGPEVKMLFDEAVQPAENRIILDRGDPVSLEVRDGNSIVLTPETDLPAGALCRAALTVEDLKGNSTRFILPFWAWNPDLPDVLINEFNPEGSDSNPDCIELYVESAGDCAGLCLYYGTKNFYDYRYVFPSLQVEAGEFIIIHCRRDFLAGEISESTDMTLSTGKLSCDTAWDLWLPEDSGLSGANGILSLYSSPDGKIKDAAVYSERDPDPEDDYLGWTSRTFDPAADVYREGGWDFSSEAISPAEAILSLYTTATRSLCRSSGSGDTDCAADWHTAPTSGKTFGEVNTDEEYIPPP